MIRSAALLLTALALASARPASAERRPAGAQMDAVQVPDAGHGQKAWWKYNIYGTGSGQDARLGLGNCHNAANNFVSAATGRGLQAGILVCHGDPEQSPAYHTANWVVVGDRTAIVNWGHTCSWKASQAPPDISRGTALGCAYWACGDQYVKGETRVMPAGEYVERAGPAICTLKAAGGQLNKPVDGAKTDFSRGRLDDCLKCCDDRADMWTDKGPDEVHMKGMFRGKCKKFCDNAFAKQ